MTHPIELKLQLFLQDAHKNGVELPLELVKEFEELCTELIEKQFVSPDTKAASQRKVLRVSSAGSPVCKLLHQKHHKPKDPSTDPYFLLRMLYGDMAEALLVVLLKAAGVNIEDTSVRVSLDNYEGTLDCIIDGGVWDIKTASDYSFKNKFKDFKTLEADDPFGYVVQGFLYGEAVGLPFKGWIVMNKSSAEVKVIEVPLGYKQYKDKALKQANETYEFVTGHEDPDNIPRSFELEEEFFNRKPTGSKVLGTSCRFCDYKLACWKDVELKPNPKSRAKFPPWRWEYTGDES